MLRIYCDTNIYSLIKEDNKNFNSNLQELMNELKDSHIFTYSHAHHVDLSNSKQEYWQKDLEFLENYVKNHYFNYNPIKKYTECLLAKPTESFYSTDFALYNSYLSPDFNMMDLLFDEQDNAGNNEIVKKYNEVFKTLLDIQIPNLFNIDVLDPHASAINKLLPNQENLTIGSLTSHFLKYGQQILSEKEEFKSLKKLISDYADSDKYSFEKWKDQYDEKFRENFQGKSFTEIMQQLFDSVPNYNDYDKFILFFSCLEGYNVTKDKPLRKSQGFDSIHTDANHSWYASFSDFLISDDKGLRAKAYITYKFFNIKTEIFDVGEFLNYGQIFLQQEEISWKTFIDNIIYQPEKNVILDTSETTEGNVSVTVQSRNHIFNYFNRIRYTNNSVILYCQRYFNSNFIMYKEGELLTNKLIKLLGIDSYEEGDYSFEQDSKKTEIIREWLTEELMITFGFAQNVGGNCYCLELLFQGKSYQKE